MTGKNVKNSSLTGRDLRNGSVGGVDVKDRSLLNRDFKVGQLPAGPRGLQGLPGGRGPKGDTGTVDTSNFYTKSASDARFLGIGATAANSTRLNGLEAEGYLADLRGSASALAGTVLFTMFTVAGYGELRASCLNPAQPVVTWRNTSGTAQQVYVDDGGDPADHFGAMPDGADAGTTTGTSNPAEADHVVYMLRNPNPVFVDVFDSLIGGICVFAVRAYGDFG